MSEGPTPPPSSVATRRGDDGTTGLLFGGGERIPKDDPRVEAYGTVDEAVAALGLARAELGLKDQYGVLPASLSGLAGLLLRLQRELFVVAAELATRPGGRDRLEDGVSRVTAEMVAGLDDLLAQTEPHIRLPREFVVPGESRLSAALELARTVVRRAERRAVGLAHQGGLEGTSSRVVPYLNRLGDLLWVLARATEQAEARTAPPARPGRRGARQPTGRGSPG